MLRPALVLLLVLAAAPARAAVPPAAPLIVPADSLAPETPASLRAALLHGPFDDGARPILGRAAGGRSVPIALGLSAVVPGAGQAYNRQWIKAAVSVAAEVALIVGYRGLVRDGRAEEDAYQAYAHAYWDPAKYAQWLEDYSAFLPNVGAREIAVPQGIDFQNPGAWTSAERAAARRFFDAIRAVESVVYHPSTGASFSHKLPYYGDQQYYELIGKYYQFAPGWTDYPAWTDGDGYTGAIDPDEAGPDGEKIHVRGRFWDYARDHAHANDLLRNAQRVSGLIVLNHIIAAVDAAVFAKIHNDRLDADVAFTTGAGGETAPVASVRWTF